MDIEKITKNKVYFSIQSIPWIDFIYYKLENFIGRVSDMFDITKDEKDKGKKWYSYYLFEEWMDKKIIENINNFLSYHNQ